MKISQLETFYLLDITTWFPKRSRHKRVTSIIWLLLLRPGAIRRIKCICTSEVGHRQCSKRLVACWHPAITQITDKLLIFASGGTHFSVLIENVLNRNSFFSRRLIWWCVHDDADLSVHNKFIYRKLSCGHLVLWNDKEIIKWNLQAQLQYLISYNRTEVKSNEI